MLRVELGLVCTVAHGHEIALPHVEPRDLRTVVVALKHLDGRGYGLLLERHDDAVDERNGLAAVLEMARRPVRGLAFARIGLEAKVRVAPHDVLAVLARFDEHVGPRADGPGGERHVVARQRAVGIKALGLPRHRREEGHRQPVAELRILSADRDFERMRIERAHAFKGACPQIEPGLLPVLGAKGFVARGELRVERLEARHVLRQDAEHRAHDPRTCDALDAVDEILGHKLARAFFGKLHRVRDRRGKLRVEIMVEVGARGVPCKARVRRKAHALFDRDPVDAPINAGRRRVGRQHPPVPVDINGLDDLGRRTRLKLVRALEIVVAVGRLVDRIGVERLVARVGRLRIERLGASARKA